MLGIDPAANVAEAPRSAGCPTLVEFFDDVVGARGSRPKACRADLLIGNNVLAQVTDLHSFVAGIDHLLAPAGCARSSSRTCCG